MTENECINKIKWRIDIASAIAGDGEDGKAFEDLEMAIQALEDMQKLKELGECYIIPKNGTFEINGIDVHTAVEELEQYRAIGTVEEFKTLKEKNVAKKVAYQGEHEKCPTCGSFHVFGKHCTECGQAVDYD